MANGTSGKSQAATPPKNNLPATQAQGGMTTTQPSAGVMALMEGQETGFEGTSQADYSIPFLALLQKLSPQCDRDETAFLEAARPGMFFDGASGELLESVRLIPCHYSRKIVEWKPERKGFVAVHEPGIEEGMEKNEKGIPVNKEGNLFIDTRYFFCLRLKENGDAAPVVVSLSSTQIKKSKAWLTRMEGLKINGKGTPMYSQIWKGTASDESNDKGSWKGWKFDFEGYVPDEITFKKAKDSREMFKTTEVKPQVMDEEVAGAKDKSKAAM